MRSPHHTDKVDVGSTSQVLYSLEGFYRASTEVTRQDFKQFAQPALARNTAIHSVNWIRRVPAAQKAAYERRIRAEDFPAFQIYFSLTSLVRNF
ncbi:CHASE domain-containing protein [Microcoleus sp. N9_B4]|uniref:CHASE domain-containing protein n=1 Tax=Microcoleus sp. N9_B4 TaxID=3055386 RepID=UPI002FD5E827